MSLLFDIETDGLDATKVHVLVTKNLFTDEVTTYRGNQVKQGVFHLLGASRVVAHNGIKFDIPILERLYGVTFEQSSVVDTLVLSRLIYSDLGDADTKLMAEGKLPGRLYKSHSLEAWGYRLGCHKGDYQGGWEEWNQDMENYCVQDVEVLEKLYLHLVGKNYSQRAIDLEHKVAFICAKQERHGFLFDIPKAGELYATLVKKKLELERKLQETFTPRFLSGGKVKEPKADNKKYGYSKGARFTPVVLTEFNPGSRDHIATWLKRMRGWKPEKLTQEGKAQVDETILSSLPYPEAKIMAEYLMLTKRIGQLAEGDQAWLKQVKQDGRLHGSVITNGAVTGRATHAYPNLAQVPSCSAPYGADCRSLFTVPEGKALVGADLSGLELRCLAHYMAKWDKGAYGQLLLEGDIHTANQEAAGLPTRNDAKTFIYAFLYGAGNEKIGKIVGKDAVHGGRLKRKFLSKTPALNSLVEAVKAKAERDKVLVGLDGRKLHVRSSHAALNTLLQSAGALIAKQALVEFDNIIQAKGWTKRVQQVAWVHDEIQVECDEDIAESVGQETIRAFELAGEYFGFRIPITGEFRVGSNWKETH